MISVSDFPIDVFCLGNFWVFTKKGEPSKPIRLDIKSKAT
jgi:hypothetical protein